MFREFSEELPIHKETFETPTGHFVEVVQRLFEPEGGASEECAIVFLPGWLISAQNASVDGLCRALSKQMGMRTFAMSASCAGGCVHGLQALADEARAIASHLRLLELRDVIVVGHSRGGNLGIHLTALLQKENGIRIRGLICMNAVGLSGDGTDWQAHEQADAIGRELSVHALRGLRDKHVTDVEMRFALDMSGNLAREAGQYRATYPLHLKDEAYSASTKNPHLQDIQVPVVFLFCTEDTVAPLPEGVKDMKELVPKSPHVKTLRIEGSHIWPFEYPAEAAKRTLRALITD